MLMNRILNMLKNCRFMRDVHGKAGMTLTEVVLVVAIMGILSGMGVSSFQSAIANARTKDAAYNVTAFMEKTANEARRLSTTLCVQVASGNTRKLLTFRSSCPANAGQDTRIDSLVLEGASRIINSDVPSASLIGSVNFASTGAEFTPRQGLSAAPNKGFFVIRYGNSDVYGAASKQDKQNSFVPLLKVSTDTDWAGI